jgi:hypothetical protein
MLIKKDRPKWDRPFLFGMKEVSYSTTTFRTSGVPSTFNRSV